MEAKLFHRCSWIFISPHNSCTTAVLSVRVLDYHYLKPMWSPTVHLLLGRRVGVSQYIPLVCENSTSFVSEAANVQGSANLFYDAFILPSLHTWNRWKTTQQFCIGAQNNTHSVEDPQGEFCAMAITPHVRMYLCIVSVGFEMLTYAIYLHTLFGQPG